MQTRGSRQEKIYQGSEHVLPKVGLKRLIQEIPLLPLHPSQGHCSRYARPMVKVAQSSRPLRQHHQKLQDRGTVPGAPSLMYLVLLCRLTLRKPFAFLRSVRSSIAPRSNRRRFR